MSSYYMDNSYAEGGLDSNKLKEEFVKNYMKPLGLAVALLFLYFVFIKDASITVHYPNMIHGALLLGSVLGSWFLSKKY